MNENNLGLGPKSRLAQGKGKPGETRRERIISVVELTRIELATS
jgi:hypothetical protein